MFTGIVDRGDVVKVEPLREGSRLWVASPVLHDGEIGGSVSIDGVCLTIVESDGDVCSFDVSAESLLRSALGERSAGDAVNVERPVRAGDELGGHIVQGHVDGVGTIVSCEPEGEGRRIRVQIPATLMRYVVEKGSVTLDGVSLTVTRLDDDGFDVALVPHTLAVTTFGTVGPGRSVNVEVDVLAKYVERLGSAK